MPTEEMSAKLLDPVWRAAHIKPVVVDCPAGTEPDQVHNDVGY